MAGPPDEEPAPDEALPPASRPELRLIEARDAQERTCGECGKKTSAWRPVRRKGTSVILCAECAAKPPPTEGGCPNCGAALSPLDTFCGKCGTRIEYACPTCGAILEPEDAFCGKCGAKLA